MDMSCYEIYDEADYDTEDKEWLIVPVYYIGRCFDGVYNWLIETPDFHIVRFGRVGIPNYLSTQEECVRDEYVNNCKLDLSLDNMCNADFWERYLLFNKESLYLSIKDVEQQFTIEIRTLPEGWTPWQ